MEVCSCKGGKWGCLCGAGGGVVLIDVGVQRGERVKVESGGGVGARVWESACARSDCASGGSGGVCVEKGVELH